MSARDDLRSALGSVTRVSKGVWRVRVELAPDPATGKRRSRERRVRGTRREAEDVCAKMAAEAKLARMAAEDDRVREVVERRREKSEAGRMTLSEYLDRVYLPHAASRLREDTMEGYRRDVENHIRPVLGSVPLAELDEEKVELMLESVEMPGARKSAYKTLRQALRQARKRRMVEWVATDAVAEPKVPRYEPVVLDAEQARAVLEAFRGDPVEPAVLMALGCGLRRSEICGLDWEDLDLAAREVRVHDPVVYVRGRECRNGTKTPNSLRTVSIPAGFAARLAEIRPEAARGPLLPGTAEGGRMHPDSVSVRYTAVCKRHKCHWTSLKNLRHSHATIMLEAGVDVVTVSRRLGHSSVSVTDRFYLRPRRAADERAAGAFDSLEML